MHAKLIVQWKQMGCQLPHPLGMFSKSNHVHPPCSPTSPRMGVVGHTIGGYIISSLASYHNDDNNIIPEVYYIVYIMLCTIATDHKTCMHALANNITLQPIPNLGKLYYIPIS